MNRTQTWVAVIVLGIGVLMALILGHFAYLTFTATPLHPNAQDAPSVIKAAPSPGWKSSVTNAQRITRDNLSEQNLPGLSVAVGINGDLVWAEGFGWANIDSETRVTPATRFRTGGISIALTSAAAGLMLEKNQLSLDAEIQTYVPAYPKKQWPVTLRQLMGHVGGIVGDHGDEESMEHCDQTADGMPRFANTRLTLEPGTTFRYTPYGWILVSAAIEAAAHESFFSLMRSRIFEPLAMDATIPDSSSEPIADLATFYHPRFAGNTRYGPEMSREGDYSCFAGGGGFLSTPSDLVRFAMAINGGTLLKPSTVTLLHTSQRLASGQETGYGLGWDLESVAINGEPTRQVGHDIEFMLGGSALLATFPERGIVVVVMTNIAFADMQSLAVEIAQAFAEEARRSPVRPTAPHGAT